MSENRATVSTGALLSVSTGRMLSDFGEFHHAADVLMGQALMTHQFASEAVADQVAREAKRQHPWLDTIDMDTFPDLNGLSREDAEQACRAFVDAVSDIHGAEHEIVSPPETRHVPFTEGLPAKFGGAV